MYTFQSLYKGKKPNWTYAHDLLFSRKKIGFYRNPKGGISGNFPLSAEKLARLIVIEIWLNILLLKRKHTTVSFSWCLKKPNVAMFLAYSNIYHCSRRELCSAAKCRGDIIVKIPIFLQCFFSELTLSPLPKSSENESCFCSCCWWVSGEVICLGNKVPCFYLYFESFYVLTNLTKWQKISWLGKGRQCAL